MLSTFGFSHRPSGGIGFGAAIFAPGLSPLQQATPFFNAPAGAISTPFSAAAQCTGLGAGVGPLSSTFANFVSLSAGATLCGSYTNGRDLLAINATGSVLGLNTFPTAAADNGQPSYRNMVSNAVFRACSQVIKWPFDARPTSCPNPLKLTEKGTPVRR